MNLPIDLKDKELPLEFFICKKKDLKQRMTMMTHLSEFVRNSNAKHYRLGDKEAGDKNTLMIMAEHDEVANQLIDEECGQVLKKFGGFIQTIHITDQKLYNGFPLFARAEILMPTSDSDALANEALQVLAGLMLRLVDNVASLRYS